MRTIACITARNILTRGRVTPAGARIELEKSLYEKLLARGDVVNAAEYDALAEAVAEANAFTNEAITAAALARESAEAQLKATIEPEAKAEAEAETKADAELDPSTPANETPKRSRKQR